MTRFISLNQSINTWECDEYDRMNVKFYFSKFADASRLFTATIGLEEILSRRISRHVRYLSELRSGAQIRILSSLVVPDDADGRPESGCFIQHIMENVSLGILAATAVDRYEGTAWPSHAEHQDTLDEHSKPRALVTPPDFGEKSPEDFGESLIGRGVIHPAMCTAEGVAREMAYVEAVSNASTDAWSQVGMTSSWLKSNGFGRVSTEMRLCVLSRLKAGEIYTLHVAFTGLGKRSCTMRYDFFDMRDGRHVAFLDSAMMLFNLETRRSNPLPDFAREAIKARII